MKQEWTKIVLSLLPATVREINANPRVREMNLIHWAKREKAGSYYDPVNSMAYDTLYRLRERGVVERDEDGVYHIVDAVNASKLREMLTKETK
jgi:hypothetical protein